MWNRLCSTEHVKPLVYVFAGPSNHGQKETAKSLSKMLSMKFWSFDDSDVNGTVLSLESVKKVASRCVVYLDEQLLKVRANYLILLEILQTGGSKPTLDEV